MPKITVKAKAAIDETLKKMTREQVSAIANSIIDAFKFAIDNDDDDLLRDRVTEYMIFFEKMIEKKSIPNDLKEALNEAIEKNDTTKLAIVLQDYAAALTILFPIIEQPGNAKLVESYLRWKSTRK